VASPRRVGRLLLRSSLLEALAYPHGVDRYLELVRPLLVKDQVRAEVTAVRCQTPKSVTLRLRPNESWRGLRAGQFVGLSVSIDGVRETRPYSPAGSQHAAGGVLELTVSTHPEGKVSRYLRDHARPGMIVGLTQAEGDFVLPDPRPERVLLISGGSGITPVMAMLRTLCDEGFAGDIGFLNYARSSGLALYGAELDRLVDRHEGLRVARGFTRGRRLPLDGRFRREHLGTVISEHADAATFVCGPPTLIDAVRARVDAGRSLRAGGRDVHAAGVELRYGQRRRLRQLPRQRPPGRQQWPAAARSGGGCGARPRARMSYGHLQHLQLPEDRRHRPKRHHRRALDRQGRAHSDLRVRTGRRRSTRPMNPDIEKEPVMSTPAPSLTPEQLEAFGQELDAIRARVVADLGERDADYINKVIRTQRGLELAGRGLLFLGFLPPAWIGGTAALSLSKILDNMEIGHNVMHGQYDWMKDARLNGKTFEWDTACPGDQWRHSHNYMHHTHTNIVGKDRDIGYGILRMSEEESWHPYYLGNPLYAALLAIFFQYGVALHDLEAERLAAGETTLAEKRGMLGDIWRKVRGQTLKDYVLFPLLSGPSLPFVLAGDASANLVRNLWSFTIIFCGHFPDGTQQFTEEQAENESRGEWYYRQLLGSANLTGGKLFHILAGNLSFQIEHHLFPDLPAHRYAEISTEVSEITERYRIPYNTGPLHRQFGSVVRKIGKLALPSLPGRGGGEPDGVKDAVEACPQERRAAA